MQKKESCNETYPKLSEEVRSLIIRKLCQLRRKQQIRGVGMMQAAYTKLHEKILENIKAGRLGRVLITVPVSVYREIVDSATAMTKEWPGIVWEVMASTLERAQVSSVDSQDLNAIVDEHAWHVGQHPFTLDYIDCNRFKESVECEVRRYGLDVPPSFNRFLSLATAAGQCNVINIARQEREGIGIAIDEYVIAQRQNALLFDCEGRQCAGLPAPPEGNICRREGQIWTLSYNGETKSVNHSKGLLYISYLLGSPFQKYHVGELIKVFENPEQEILSFSSGEVSTKETVANYRKRLLEIRGELAEVENQEESGITLGVEDLLQKKELLGEQEELEKQIKQAVGMGGKLKKNPDETTRQAKAISTAISRSLETIKKYHPTLWQHLFNAISRGEYLSYTPETNISWTTAQ